MHFYGQSNQEKQTCPNPDNRSHKFCSPPYRENLVPAVAGQSIFASWNFVAHTNTPGVRASGLWQSIVYGSNIRKSLSRPRHLTLSQHIHVMSHAGWRIVLGGKSGPRRRAPMFSGRVPGGLRGFLLSRSERALYRSEGRFLCLALTHNMHNAYPCNSATILATAPGANRGVYRVLPPKQKICDVST